MREEAFQLAMRADPDDDSPRLIFADWLEEQGDPRAELLRLTHALTRSLTIANRPACEARIRELLAEGVQPIGPRWTNSLGMQFAWIPAGTFLQGSPSTEAHRQSDETQHAVTLTRGFYLGIHLVTQDQWQAVMGENPSRFPGPDRPVEGVSWNDCEEFCRRLSRKEGLGIGPPSPFRLPTEAEWEYACRAGTGSPYFFGNTLHPDKANYHDNYQLESGPSRPSGRETTPVQHFPMNAWGMHDMHGNVFEWCADRYGPYPITAVDDPHTATGNGVPVLRGGSWHSLMQRCRSACRGWGPPGYRGSDVGFRVCFRLNSDYTL